MARFESDEHLARLDAALIVLGQAAEVVADDRPRRYVVGQLPPRAARAQDVAHASDDLAPHVARRAPARRGRGDQRLQLDPFPLADITWMGFAPARRGGFHALTLSLFLTPSHGRDIGGECMAVPIWGLG